MTEFTHLDFTNKLFSMHHDNKNCLGLYRLSMRQLNKIVIFKNKPI